MEKVNYSTYSTHYSNLSVNAFSPYIAEAKKKIDDKKDPQTGKSKREYFTHLANIFEAGCKRCFSNNKQGVGSESVKKVMEAAVRLVLGFDGESKFVKNLDKTSALYSFYEYLILGFTEETSLQYLHKIEKHKGVLSEKFQSFFNHDIKYTNTVETLLKLSKHWEDALKSDSKGDWLYDWFLSKGNQSQVKEPEPMPRLDSSRTEPSVRSEYRVDRTEYREEIKESRELVIPIMKIEEKVSEIYESPLDALLNKVKKKQEVTLSELVKAFDTWGECEKRKQIFDLCPAALQEQVFIRIRTLGLSFATFLTETYSENVSFEDKKHFIVSHAGCPSLAKEFILSCSPEELQQILIDLPIKHLEFVGYCAQVLGDAWDFESYLELIVSQQGEYQFKKFLEQLSSAQLFTILPKLELKILDDIRYYAQRVGAAFPIEHYMVTIFEEANNYRFGSFLDSLDDELLSRILPELQIADVSLLKKYIQRLQNRFPIASYLEIIVSKQEDYYFGGLLKSCTKQQLAMLLPNVKLNSMDLIEHCLDKLESDFDIDPYVDLIADMHRWEFKKIVKKLSEDQLYTVMNNREEVDFELFIYCLERLRGRLHIINYLGLIKSNMYNLERYSKLFTPEQYKIVIANANNITSTIMEEGIDIIGEDFDFEINTFESFFKLFTKREGQLNLEYHIELIAKNQDHKDFDQFLRKLSKEQLALVLERIELDGFELLQHCLKTLQAEFDIAKYVDLINANLDQFEEDRVVRLLSKSQLQYLMPRLARHSKSIVADCITVFGSDFNFKIKNLEFLIELLQSDLEFLDIEQHLELIVSNKDHKDFVKLIKQLSTQQLELVISHIELESFELFHYCLKELRAKMDISGYVSLINEHIEEFDRGSVIKLLSKEQLQYLLPELKRHSSQIIEVSIDVLGNEFNCEIKSFKFLYRLLEKQRDHLNIAPYLNLIIESQEVYEFDQFLEMLSDEQLSVVIPAVRTNDFNILKRSLSVLKGNFNLRGYGELVDSKVNSYGSPQHEFLFMLSAQQINEILPDLNIDDKLFSKLIEHFGDDIDVSLMATYILSKEGYAISMPKLLNELSGKHLQDVHDRVKFRECLYGPSSILEKLQAEADVSKFIDAFKAEESEGKIVQFMKLCSPEQLNTLRFRAPVKYAQYENTIA